MANSRSARKRIRVNETKRLRNKAARSAVRTKITRARRTLLSVSGETVGTLEQELKSAVSALDRAAEKGILHRNNAARRKSRLATMAGKLMRAVTTGTEAEQEAVRTMAIGGQKGRSTKAAARTKKGTVAKSVTKSTLPKAAASRAKTPAGKATVDKTPAKATVDPKR